jgi:hypothetical protein
MRSYAGLILSKTNAYMPCSVVPEIMSRWPIFLKLSEADCWGFATINYPKNDWSNPGRFVLTIGVSVGPGSNNTVSILDFTSF